MLKPTMEEIEFLRNLGTMIVAAAALLLLFGRANIPSIVTYILTGLGLSVLFFYLAPEWFLDRTPEALWTSPAIDTISEVGIALLLFIVGLELSLEKIRDVGRVAILAGLGQVIFTAIGGFGIAIALGFSVIESIVLATALTFSSTVVVVKLLDQKKEIHTLYGRIAIGIFLVQDLVVIFALTFLAGLGDPETVDSTSVAVSLAMAFLGMAGLLGAALFASRYLLPKPFGWAARSPDMLFIWSLGWCFLFVVSAELLGLSPEIGAFLAGISLAQLDCSRDLSRRVHPLMNFFIAIFFVSLGARLELQAAFQDWFSALILSLFVLIGNPFIFMWIISACGYGERTSFLTSVTVAQISEFSFIFAALGLSSGLIDETILSLVAMVGLVTIAVSAYMILYNQQLYDFTKGLGLLRMFRTSWSKIDEDEYSPHLKDHVIVVGMNTMGRSIIQGLHDRNEVVLAVDTDARKLATVPGHHLHGSVEYIALVEEMFLPDAKLAVSTLRIEDINNLFAYQCRRLGVPIAVHAFERIVVRNLQTLQVDYIIDSKVFGAAALLEEIRRVGAVR